MPNLMEICSLWALNTTTKRRSQPNRYAFVHDISTNNSQKLEVAVPEMGALWTTTA